MKIFSIALVVFMSLILFACSGSNTYVPPSECVQNSDGEYNSLILKQVKNPARLSLYIKIAGITAVKNGKVITKESLLKVLDKVEESLDNSIYFSTFIPYVLNLFDTENKEYAAIIFVLSPELLPLNQQMMITPCDKALIKSHIASQRLSLAML